jgi:8-oxo-dGTP pyrophosphatase MutT (NUDIX family)
MLRTLRGRLLDIEQAESLVDSVEGQHPSARKAAVLLPLFEEQGVLHLLFIRRASTLRSHSGEIAFPGGATDSSDLSAVMTALRETQEEIGLDPQRVEVLGMLPPVFTVVSNFLIMPIVAYLPRGLGTLSLQQSEVAELITLPLSALADPTIAYTEQWIRDGRARTVYFYDYDSYHIWGATGRILNSLLLILQEHEERPLTQ